MGGEKRSPCSLATNTSPQVARRAALDRHPQLVNGADRKASKPRAQRTGRRSARETVAEVPLTGLSFCTLLTETFRSLFRILSYPQILLKTLLKIGGRQVSHLSLAQIA